MAGFPNSPSIGETYTLGTKVWEWDGTIWKIKTTGAVGPQGVQGAQGNQGTAGAGGVQGNQGWQGPVGPQGNQGRQGISGPQGNQGRQGISGPQGNQGNQGIAGVSAVGVQGPQGRQGNQGNQGNQGRQGIVGPTGFISTPGNLSVASGKFRLHPLYGSTIVDDPDGNYWLQQTNPQSVINGIEYDQDVDLTIFNKYGERLVSIGNAAASLTANLFSGNIFSVNFAGYTGTCTINITGNVAEGQFVENIMFYFDNSSGNTAPTITFTSKGQTGKVLFSEETGAPVFSNTAQVVFVPIVYIREGSGEQYWFAGSQLTFDL